jgi:LemA protein
MTAAYIAVGLGVVLLIWAALAFNALVAAHNQVNEAWSGIDVQLKRRHDLVPNLVETVREYADHENALLRGVTEARDNAAGSSGRRGRQAAEYELSQAIVGVRVLSEQYPDLRASEQFRRLQAQLAEIEGEIQYARRIYNTNVQRYNRRVKGFPGLLVRRLGGFHATGYFELTPVRLNGAPASELGDGADEGSKVAAA